MPTKTKFYAVAQGRNPGLYHNWDDCRAQTDKFKGSKYRSFEKKDEAEKYLIRSGIYVEPEGANSSPDLETQSQSSTSTFTTLSALSLTGPSVGEGRGQKRPRIDRSPTPEELEEVSIADIVDMLGGRWNGEDKVMIPVLVMNKLLRLNYDRLRGL